MDKWANHSSNIYHNWSPGDILILDKDHNKTNDKHNKQLIIYHCSPEHIQGTYRGSAQWVFDMPNSDQYNISLILIFSKIPLSIEIFSKIFLAILIELFSDVFIIDINTDFCQKILINIDIFLSDIFN